MVTHYDAVLAAIPILAVSGLALRTAVAATGIATGLLAVPLGPAGPAAAAGVIFRELFFGPVAQSADDSSS